MKCVVVAPLHLSSADGKWNVASKLVELGADIRFKDRWGKDAIDAGAGGGHLDLHSHLQLLVDAGKNAAC